MDKQLDRVRATPCDDVVVEEKKVKSYGENYQAVKVKNKINLRKLFVMIFGFLATAGVVLAVLVVCGI